MVRNKCQWLPEESISKQEAIKQAWHKKMKEETQKISPRIFQKRLKADAVIWGLKASQNLAGSEERKQKVE